MGPSRHRARAGGRSARSVLAGVALSMLAFGATAESLRGDVTIGIEGVPLREAGAVVVFLESEGDRAAAAERVAPAVAIRQSGARFEPDFLVVSVGQQVEMPNDDVIYHNVFSYSRPNDFDLGLYASGESHGIRFAHAGLVRIYCSIHDEMDGLIFVAPSRVHATVDADGRYAIEGVPGGRYRLHVWSERLPEWVATIEIPPGEAVERDVEIGRPTPSVPAAPAGATPTGAAPPGAARVDG